MWDCVGIVRSSYLLHEAAEKIEVIRDSVDRYFFSHALSYPSLELRNMITVGCLVIESALRRKESRGLQYILDYPDLDDENWKKDTLIDRKGSSIWQNNIN